MKTLVLGIGNTILGDDGVGVETVKAIAERISDDNVDILDTPYDGLNLFDFIRDYERLIVIDAVLTQNSEAGKVYRLTPDALPPPSASGAASHNLNLATTLELGNRLFPGEMPREVTIFTVAIDDVVTITEEMTDSVKQAIPELIDLVLIELGLA